MSFLDRLIGLEDRVIPIHHFHYLLSAYARGDLTGAECRTFVETNYGGPLDAGEIVSIQEFLTVLNSHGPQLADKLDYAELTEQVLGLTREDLRKGGTTIDKARCKTLLGITAD